MARLLVREVERDVKWLHASRFRKAKHPESSPGQAQHEGGIGSCNSEISSNGHRFQALQKNGGEVSARLCANQNSEGGEEWGQKPGGRGSFGFQTLETRRF